MSAETLGTWIGDYLTDLAARAYRPRTLDTYRKALTRLALELARARDAAALLRELADLAPNTRALYLSVARTFDRWCLETERTPRLALGGTVRVKLDDPAPRPFATAELRRLDAAATALGRGTDHGRTRLLYFILRETGIRIGSALALRREDVVVDPGREGLRIRAPKGRKDRFAPIFPGPLLALLRSELGQTRRRRRGTEADDRPEARGYLLHVGEDGRRPWSYRAALVAFKRLAAAAGLTQAVPHQLRHSRATELADRGASAFVLRQALGWAKLDTASRYVRDQELRAELERLDQRGA